MSRLATCFKNLRSAGKTALIPYISAGDPNPDVTVPLMHTMVESGADIIELGVPFSDPMADGPVIQRASERALEHNVSLRDVINMVAQFRQQDSDTPVALMGYMNPLEIMGIDEFCTLAAKAGVDGVLTVDMPPEEAADWVNALRAAEIDPIFLLAPTTDDARISLITKQASGYLYYVSVKGITGAGNLDVGSVSKKLQQIRRGSDLPVAVGFGIKDGQSAAAVADIADAVVIGSAIIQRIEQHLSQPDKIAADVASFVSTIRRAMDGTS